MKRLFHAVKLRLWTHALIRINGVSYVDWRIALFVQACQQQQMAEQLGAEWDA